MTKSEISRLAEALTEGVEVKVYPFLTDDPEWYEIRFWINKKEMLAALCKFKPENQAA